MAKVRFRSHTHIDKKKELAKTQAMDRVSEFSFTGDEDAFVKQIKAAFPGISGTELLEKIALFRELKRLRSSGS
jgi:hypothetical protein